MQTINTHFSNPNNFSQPIEQIENKGHQIANYGMEKIYEAAHLSEDKQGSLVNVLNAMVVHFSDPTANSNSDDLQEAIAVLIMSQFDRNDLPVTDLNILLAKGIDLYKQKTNNITSFNHLPIEIHPSHHQLLSINDQRSLALTCNPQFEIYDKSWQFKLNTEGQSLSEQLRINDRCVLHAKKLFLADPQYRLERFLPTDQVGIDYLQNQLGLNCGPNTIQKIKNGEFTIEQAKNEMQEKMPSALQIYKELIQKWPEKEWVLNSFKIKNRFIKYFIDGSLTIEQSDLWNLIYYFLDKVQKYLDNGQMSLGWYLDLKTGDQWYFQEILENEKIQEGLNNRKITIQQLIKLDFYYFSYVIKDEIIQKCLENNDLTLEQLVNLPHYFKFFRVLTEERVQPLLLSKKLTIEQLLTCTPAGYDVLRHPHGTDAIFQGKITVEQVLKSTDEQYKILNSGNSDGVNKYVRALNNDNCIIS